MRFCAICGKEISSGQPYRAKGPLDKERECRHVRCEQEKPLRDIIRDGVAMLEATWGDTEKRCAEMKATGNVETLPDGTESYGQPWDWLRRAKEAL